MSELVSWMPIRLKPGVDVAEFERFVTEEFARAPFPTGMVGHILKGERGEHVAGYVVMNVFDGVEARNRYFPSFESGPSEEFREWEKAHERLIAKWREFAEADAYTDYVTVASHRA